MWHRDKPEPNGRNSYMENQLNLFDDAPFDITPKLTSIRNSMMSEWTPFSIDNLQKTGKIYGVTCNYVWDTFEKVIENNCV